MNTDETPEYQNTMRRAVATQARDYVLSVGVTEAKKSNHYLTAVQHCKCGECFCCGVLKAVNELEDK